MSKSAWLGVAALLMAASALAVHARRVEQADELTERALRLLHPPLSEAPSLRDLRGREARALLEEAQALVESRERAELIAIARAAELYSQGRYEQAERTLSGSGEPTALARAEPEGQNVSEREARAARPQAEPTALARAEPDGQNVSEREARAARPQAEPITLARAEPDGQNASEREARAARPQAEPTALARAEPEGQNVSEREARAARPQAEPTALARAEPDGQNVSEREARGGALERVEGLQLLAAIKLMRGQPAQADRILAGTYPRDKDDARAAVLRSDVARALGRGDLALSVLAPFLAQGDGNSALYERRGLAHALLGQRAEARADLMRAAELDRKAVSPLLALGRMQREAGALSEAILAFHEASQRAPDEAEAWLGAGVCRAALGDTTAARIDFERAAAAAPARAEPLIALADIDIAHHNLGNALRRYRAATLLDPKSAIARLKLANALMRADDVAQAITQYRAALAEQPDMAAAHNGLGAALYAKGELAAAESELKSAAALDPKDPHPWLNLARLYKRQGNVSAQQFALARAHDPSLTVAD